MSVHWCGRRGGRQGTGADSGIGRPWYGVLEAGPAVGAWIGDRLVGFARAATDGAFRVYVDDVVVASDAGHAGIGRSVVARLLELEPTTAVASLFCSPDLTDLYAEHGFRATSQLVMRRQPNP